MVRELRVNGTAAHAALAAVLAGCAVAAALAWPGVRPLDPTGAALLVALHAPLVPMRRWPAPSLAALVVLAVPYHLLQYQHHAAVPAEVIALFAYAVLGRRVRTVLTAAALLLFLCAAGFAMREGGGSVREQVAVIEAVVAAVIGFQVWRSHRARLAAVVERAERAERDREQEARRRVAEERLRIARDLHDLLAHSITVIGVQAGAAAHLVAGDRPVDRAELAEALGGIAATCRDARTELRATLQVLRADDDAPGPLPRPGRVGDLADAARAAGLDVTLIEEGDGSPVPEVGVAAYRIVQEALTNVVKHARAGAVDIRLVRADGHLTVTVADDGRGAAGDGPHGYGILGMSERARSVGGTLRAGPAPGGGFRVSAALPLTGAPVPAPRTG
ncbi:MULTISPECIES: sensor histidine kinase [Actinomadura]|uniref:histidine kinase n=1 Tax=Actinomadura yumaensis TaxID=111807 RepID=A0ABW2CTR9_9ACTN|nr:sensor histidine kinase [Actinomadura sp. J1-007]MWK39702.1 sensor histidine kinase [Actinomadura sp. J1-007]